METVDEEFLASTLSFMDGAADAGKPFFIWFNTTRMPIWTHLKPEYRGKTGIGLYPDGIPSRTTRFRSAAHCLLPASTTTCSGAPMLWNS